MRFLQDGLTILAGASKLGAPRSVPVALLLSYLLSYLPTDRLWRFKAALAI